MPAARGALSWLQSVGNRRVLQPREPAEILGNARFHNQESFCWFWIFYVTVMTVCLIEMPIPDCPWVLVWGFFGGCFFFFWFSPPLLFFE